MRFFQHRHSRAGGNPSPEPAPSRKIRRWPPACAAVTMGLVFLISATSAPAQDGLPPAPYAYRQLDDPAQEAAAHSLMLTLRCLKCQGQSIADSDAPMAGDMRSQVRERIAAGEDPEAIRGWLVERYGDYVSYAPRVTTLTWPLFAVPVLFGLAGLVVLRRRLKREDKR